ncbi:MAG: methyltransferase [Terriglobus sp.]
MATWHQLSMVELALAFLIPVTLAMVGGVWFRHPRRTFAATLLTLLWCLPALLLLQRWNLDVHWWDFQLYGGMQIVGMPLELWFGWAVLWSAVPALCFARYRVITIFIWLVLADWLLMPTMRATVRLHRSWLEGELAALMLVLLPSLLLQRWTVQGKRLGWRATLQVLAAAGVFLYLPAELVFHVYPSPGWQAYAAWPPMVRALLLQLGVVLALPGVAAVQEFATRGEGTPIPYDPPEKLVTTGMYRYVANPMQVSCLLTMLLWALLLQSAWLLCGPVVCLVYCAGIARWDEGVDLQRRFGEAWSAYRAQVHDWMPCWRPYVATSAMLYVARGCKVCSGVSIAALSTRFGDCGCGDAGCRVNHADALCVRWRRRRGRTCDGARSGACEPWLGVRGSGAAVAGCVVGGADGDGCERYGASYVRRATAGKRAAVESAVWQSRR